MMWAEAEKAVRPQGMQVERWKKERELWWLEDEMLIDWVKLYWTGKHLAWGHD